jgi:hypothetical protein
MFIQAICLAGSQAETLTAIAGILEQYSNVFRELGATDELFDCLADALFAAYSHNAVLLRFYFNEMITRTLLPVSSVAKKLTNDIFVQAMTSEPVVFVMYEDLIDRTLEICKSTILQRHALGGSFILDDSADLIPTDPVYIEKGSIAAPAASTMMTDESDVGAAAATVVDTSLENNNNNNSGDVDYNDDDQEDADGRRMRRRVEEATLMGEVSGQSVQEEERELDPLWIATEAMKSVVRNSRATYHIILAKLIGVWNTHANSMADEAIAVRLIIKSIFNRVFRSYFGLQKHLSHTLGHRVVLVDRSIHAEVLKQFSELREDKWMQNWSFLLRDTK